MPQSGIGAFFICNNFLYTGGPAMATKESYAHLSDEEMLTGFETGQLAPGNFHHCDHVRLAWICVRRFGLSQAEEKLLRGIRNMAERAGVPEKFLHTTTVAWVRLVAARLGGGNETFGNWIAEWPELMNKNILDHHYSAGILESSQARNGWLEPDLKPLECTKKPAGNTAIFR
jgi:hypothetical protein